MKRVRSDKEKKRSRERMNEIWQVRKAKKDKGANALRVSSLSADQLEFLWSKITRNVIVEPQGCWVSFAKINEKGYPVGVTLQGGRWLEDNFAFRLNFPFSVAQVALARHGKIALDAADTASHLCANRRCVNPDHIVWESQSLNARRIGCVGILICECCATTQLQCHHDPQCIKQTKIKRIAYIVGWLGRFSLHGFHPLMSPATV